METKLETTGGDTAANSVPVTVARGLDDDGLASVMEMEDRAQKEKNAKEIKKKKMKRNSTLFNMDHLDGADGQDPFGLLSSNENGINFSNFNHHMDGDDDDENENLLVTTAMSVGLNPREHEVLRNIVRKDLQEGVEETKTISFQEPIRIHSVVTKVSPTRRDHIPLARVHSIKHHD
jgi:hypothetical protein